MGATTRSRKLTTRQQFIGLIYDQLAGAVSLRDICATLESHRARLYHTGGKVPCRATLAGANRDRSYEAFSGLFACSAWRRKDLTARSARPCGSSTRPACGFLAWARNGRVSRPAFAAESVHIVYDPGLAYPVYHAVTAANVNDVTAAKEMPVEAGATYVFDLGYYDYAWWAKLDAASCHIVTRFKGNTPLTGARGRKLDAEANVLYDRAGLPRPARQAKSRKNPIAACGARDRRHDRDRQEGAHQ